MGLTIILEDEDGNECGLIEDNAIIRRILPDSYDKSSYCLRFIDLYGDTTFNNLQMTEFILELEMLMTKHTEKETTEFITKLMKLARKCQAENHMYLKFYGD